MTRWGDRLARDIIFFLLFKETMLASSLGWKMRDNHAVFGDGLNGPRCNPTRPEGRILSATHIAWRRQAHHHHRRGHRHRHRHRHHHHRHHHHLGTLEDDDDED